MSMNRESLRKHCEKMCKMYESVPSSNAYMEHKLVLDLLDQTEWIPVTERLPEEQITIGKYIFSETVLGTEGYTIRRAYYNYTTKEWFDGNEEMEWNEITHWMPLPEKPHMAEME